MNIYVLVAGTVIIIIFSWFYSVKAKRYHGITRFFSFESIFILFMLNYRSWFRDAFSWHQIVSWIFLFSSIYAGIAGFLTLIKHGKAEKNFENTTVLVRSGIYKYIRHPLYCSLLLLGTGILFKVPGTFQVIFGFINIIAIYFTGKIEEKEMIAKFGDQYIDYMKDTRMFIPFIF
jgi:protein-S-isoprenylcysteine O-methyltransferase Ste14